MVKMSNNEDNKILLSIIIPFHNRLDLLINTLASIKTNVSPEYEIILVDDGSVINDYSKLDNYISNNVLYFKIENHERGFARNFGALKSRGIYLNFFDSDDLALNNHFDSFKLFINKNKFPNIFANSYKVKNINNNTEKNIIYSGNLNKNIFKHNILSCNSVFIKKEFFLKFKFSENINLSGSEDWDLWLRIASKESIIGNNTISSVIIDHNLRTTRTQDTNKILLRINTLYKRITNKNVINLNFKLNTVKSEIYSFKSMIYSINLFNKLLSIKYLILSILLRPGRICEKRTYSIIKNLLTKFI